MSENNEFNSLANDINNTVYSQNRVSRVAKELGYSTANKANKMILEIREEILTNDEDVDFIQTGVDRENSTNLIETIIDSETDEIITSVEYEADELINSAIDKTEVVNENAVSSINIVTQQGANTGIQKGINTTVEKGATAGANKISSITTKAQKVIGVATKLGNIGNKITGTAMKFSHNMPNVDEKGNINTSSENKKQINTFSRSIGRNVIGKPVKYGTAKINKKFGKKVANKATKKLTKLEKKLTTKIEKSSIKAVRKISIFLVKLIVKIIKLIISTICAFLPMTFLLIIIIIIACIILNIFGGGMEKEDLKKYDNYMNTVQSNFQSETQEYYKEGYKVDGTYNGVAIINWRAALSILQSLDPTIDSSQEVFDFLDKMKSDGVLYTITEQTTPKYVMDEKTKIIPVSSCKINLGEPSVMYTTSFKLDKDYELDNLIVDNLLVSENDIIRTNNYHIYSFTEKSNDIRRVTASFKEVKYATTKYVVYIGVLDDYKEWVKNNTEYIKSYYKKRDISYDKNTTNFLTDDLIETIDSLYNSEDFDLMLNEAGVSMSMEYIPSGTIYDTGENNGLLAYPTTYRKLSADFPTYPSGKSHTGIDFPCPSGTPVCACADGTVILVKELNYSYGYYVVIEHNINGKRIYTLYAHNSELKVNQGENVVKGQVIALSGSTGNSTGPHCHLSVLTSWTPQNYVDPKSYL